MDLTNLGIKRYSKETDDLAIRWKGLIKCKEDFLLRNVDPRKSPFMVPEVAESWIASRNLGIDPDIKEIPVFDSKEIKHQLDENKLLIDTVIPLIDKFKHLLEISGYVLSLHSSAGTTLYLDGDQKAISLFHKYKTSQVGSFGKIGTSAHSLSMQLKKPLQFLGPENYCRLLEDNIASSTPLLDGSGNVMGALVLVQWVKEGFWDRELQNMQSHTLGWVTSIGLAIENQFKLMQQNSELKLSNSTLAATLEFIDEGIISVDHNRKINHINSEAARILNLDPDEAIGVSFEPFLGKQQNIISALTQGNTIDYKEALIKNKIAEQPFLLSIKPVLDNEKNNVGAVLRLSYPDKINALVNSRAGANAPFKFEHIIGECDAMQIVKEQGKRFAKTSENVLLAGESGTGKELFAQAIHNEYRPRGPFIAINCAAMPRNLIESELFGYEGGTFTGAERNGKPGKIELANGGTLFLDEIGDMPFEIQAVLLRVLEDKQVMRLGGQRYTKVDFRLIAATNQDLYKLIDQKLFRQDLYYRLSILKIELPPLRHRDADILLLCRYFIESYCQKRGIGVPELSNAVKKRILEYDWPGNVRQLENAMISSINMARDNIIDLPHLPREILGGNLPEHLTETGMFSAPKDGKEAISIRDAEIATITRALKRSEKNMALAADLLGIGKSTLYKKVKEYDLGHLVK
jgi:Transcriptional regulator containing PAS, AAA-type ATPase, and DNA-binding domains